jgi:hypothetical protein
MTVSWWALGISAFSLTVSALSLGWSIYSFRRTGPIVKVDMQLISGFGHRKKKPRVLEDWQYLGVNYGMHRVQYIELEMGVYNRGRSSVDIVQASFGIKGADFDMDTMSAKMNKMTPLRLEHGSKAIFKMDIVDILEGVEDAELAALEYFIGQVELGNGTSSFSQKLPYADWLEAVVSAKRDAAEFTADNAE